MGLNAGVSQSIINNPNDPKSLSDLQMTRFKLIALRMLTSKTIPFVWTDKMPIGAAERPPDVHVASETQLRLSHFQFAHYEY